MPSTDETRTLAPAEETIANSAPVTDLEAPVELWHCPNCKRSFASNFCPDCGEKKLSHHDLSLRHMLAHGVESVLHLDSKIVRSIWILLTSPGELDNTFSQGSRKRYTSPLHLFLGTNLIFFLLLPVIGWNTLTTPLEIHLHGSAYEGLAQRLVARRIAQKHTSLEEFRREFDREASLHAHSLVISMVPIFALGVWALEWRRRKFFVEHVVFSLHFYTIFLIVVMVSNSLANVALHFLRQAQVGVTPDATDHVLSLISLGILAIYLFFALRRYYRDKTSVAIVKALSLAAVIVPIMQLYRFFLLFTTLYSV